MSGRAEDVVTAAFREHHGRAVAVLTRLLGDHDLAEEAVAEACVASDEAAARTGNEA